MAVIVNDRMLTTLIDQQRVLFDHALNVGFWSTVIIVALLVISYLVAYRNHRSANSRDPVFAGQFCLAALLGIALTLVTWVIWRIDTHFEIKQFERAPATYVIKQLR